MGNWRQIGLAGLLALPLAAAPPTAKSVIEIWVWGGPSQLETFDPKPNAGSAYNNGLKSIPTNVPGIEIGELLPKLAKQADKYSIIRSMTHGINGHEIATYLMQTGRMPGTGRTYPAIGAVVAMAKSKEYRGQLPPYIALTVNKGRFSENGFLSEKFKPLATGGNPNAAKFQVDGYATPGNLGDRQTMQRDWFRKRLDNLESERPDHPRLQEFDEAGYEATRIIYGDDARAFDLSQETPQMRDRYGRNSFGQACLAARRLVEAGVPYITINAQGWDSHKKHFETMKQRTAEMDQGFAALLEDLSEKKLLDTTLVWWTGEFGRTPKIDFNEPWFGGRNHYGACFSAVVAGGGFAGGKVLGESDARAEHPVRRPVYPVEFLATLYERCGIDPAGKLENPFGETMKILPDHDPAKRLRELYKTTGGKP